MSNVHTPKGVKLHEAYTEEPSGEAQGYTGPRSVAQNLQINHKTRFHKADDAQHELTTFIALCLPDAVID